MKYKADIHIHTVLSPCGSIDMSPPLIINEAKKKNIDIIGIADHNSTLNAKVCAKLGRENNIFVLTGAEVNTKEEVHCLCFVPEDKLQQLENFIDKHRLETNINKKLKSEQYVVDENENIIKEVESFLIDAIDVSIKQLQEVVYSLNGIFIPAHVDRAYNSLSSQLGFVPPDLNFDALEISTFAFRNKFFESFNWFKQYNYISSSDAHFIKDIGKTYTYIDAKDLSFENIKSAIQKTNIINQ